MDRYLKLVELIDENGVTIGDLASKTGLSTSTLRRYLRELEAAGLVARRDDLYVTTEVGLKLKRSMQALRRTREAEPYIVTDPSSGVAVPLSFRSYEQLLAIIDGRLVDEKILMEHVRRYLPAWARNSLGDEYLAYLIESGAIKSLEDLKKYIKAVLEALEG